MPRSKQAAMRRKKRVKMLKESPLPIPIPSSSGEPFGSWFYYTGFIEGSTVVIRHSGDMDFLYRMGFFGKGTLSRSQPNFHERSRKVHVELPQKAGHRKAVQAVVINKRSYLMHQRYKAPADGKTKEYRDIVYHEEQQQGFVDSTDEDEEEDDEEEEDDNEEEDEENEEEEQEEEDEMDEDSSEDSMSSADVDTRISAARLDTGRMEAFRLLSMQNGSPAEAGQETAGASTGGKSRLSDPTYISRQVRSHLVSILAEVSLLSKEQITTFVQVPQHFQQLIEKYKRMRAAEVAMLKQMFAAQFPGRNFKQGEVMLDEEDSAAGSKRVENESDNAVVISDSDDADEKEKDNSNVSESKEMGCDDKGKGSDGNSMSGEIDGSVVIGSSQKDLTQWASDDSKFWAEEGHADVKDKNNTVQTSSEHMSEQDKALKTIDIGREENETACANIEQKPPVTEVEGLAERARKHELNGTDNDEKKETKIGSSASVAVDTVESGSLGDVKHQGCNGEEGDIDHAEGVEHSLALPVEDSSISVLDSINSHDVCIEKQESISNVSSDDISVVKDVNSSSNNEGDDSIAHKDSTHDNAMDTSQEVNGNDHVQMLINSTDDKQESSSDSLKVSMEVKSLENDKGKLLNSGEVSETLRPVSENTDLSDQSVGVKIPPDETLLTACEVSNSADSSTTPKLIKTGEDMQVSRADSITSLRNESFQALAKEETLAGDDFADSESHKPAEQISDSSSLSVGMQINSVFSVAKDGSGIENTDIVLSNADGSVAVDNVLSTTEDGGGCCIENIDKVLSNADDILGAENVSSVTKDGSSIENNEVLSNADDILGVQNVSSVTKDGISLENNDKVLSKADDILGVENMSSVPEDGCSIVRSR